MEKKETKVEIMLDPETQIQKREIIYVIEAKEDIDQSIKKISDLCMPLMVKNASDKDGYKIIRQNRINVKGLIARIEEQRKGLKAKSLDYGKRVDAEATRIREQLESIKDHLVIQEKIVEDEIERVKAEKVKKIEEEKEEERQRIKTRVDSLTKHGVIFDGYEYSLLGWSVTHEDLVSISEDAFLDRGNDLIEIIEAESERKRQEAADLEEKEAEAKKKQKKIDDDQKAEKDRLDKQKKEQDKEISRLKSEQKRINDQKQKIKDDKMKEEEEKKKEADIKKAKDEAVIKEKAENELKLKQKEDDRLAEEKRLKDEEELRLKLLPDNEKMVEYAVALEAVVVPEMLNDASSVILSSALSNLEKCNSILRQIEKSTQ